MITKIYGCTTYPKQRNKSQNSNNCQIPFSAGKYVKFNDPSSFFNKLSLTASAQWEKMEYILKLIKDKMLIPRSFDRGTFDVKGQPLMVTITQPNAKKPNDLLKKPAIAIANTNIDGQPTTDLIVIGNKGYRPGGRFDRKFDEVLKGLESLN